MTSVSQRRPAEYRRSATARTEDLVQKLTSYILLTSYCCLVWQLLDMPVRAQQQIVDPDFKGAVERPAYSRGGPTVAIDEAHSNLHTAGGQYKPFADLLTNDGYRVIASTHKFEAGDLVRIDLLVSADGPDLAS